jgi:hypothetical protein
MVSRSQKEAVPLEDTAMVSKRLFPCKLRIVVWTLILEYSRLNLAANQA